MSWNESTSEKLFVCENMSISKRERTKFCIRRLMEPTNLLIFRWKRPFSEKVQTRSAIVEYCEDKKIWRLGCKYWRKMGFQVSGISDVSDLLVSTTMRKWNMSFSMIAIISMFTSRSDVYHHILMGAAWRKLVLFWYEKSRLNGVNMVICRVPLISRRL